MKFKAIVSTLLLVGSSLSQHRIIDGDVAKPFSYPFIVSIQINGTHACGGSLLNRETVLTAAHCYFPEINYTVHAHRHNLTKSDDSENGFKSNVKSFVIHPEYNATTFQNDVAIIKLETPIKDSVDVGFVNLNDNKAYDDVGKTSKLAGWGRYNTKSNATSSLLLQGEFVNVGLDICKLRFENLDIAGNICILPIKKKVFSCQGDSGGPLFVQEEDKSVVQIGIVSYGDDDCSPNTGIPDVFTNVRHFLPWIYENAKLDELKVEKKSKISKMLMKVRSYFLH